MRAENQGGGIHRITKKQLRRDDSNGPKNIVPTARNLFLSILAGLLLIGLFPNFSLWYLAWIALLPLFILIYNSQPRAAFFYGWLTGTVFFLGLCYWLLALYSFVNGLAILAWIGLALFQGFYMGVFAFGATIIRNRYVGWGRLFIIPAWWVGIEYIRSIGSWGFSWGILGYSQQPWLNLTQIAALTGVYGISFLIIMMNVSLTEIIFASPDKKRSSLASLAVSFIILFDVVGGGFIYRRIEAQDQTVEDKTQSRFRLVAVQGNIAQEDKWDPTNEGYIKDLYCSLIRKAADFKPYLVIWPESAAPSFLLRDESYLSRLEHLSEELDCYLLTGSLHLDEHSRQFNSAILISPRGERPKKYDKMHLVLFGEYVPLRIISSFFKRFENLSWVGESIVPGREYTVFDTDRGKFSSVICFESGDSGLCRTMVKRGAQFLAVITNDAWFGRSAASVQHLQISAFRAIENGIYVVQAGNTGPSAVVNSHGQILKKTSLHRRQLLYSMASFKKSRTVYFHLGDIFSQFCLLLALGCFISVLLVEAE